METASRSQVVAEVCACGNQAVDRRRAVKDSKEQWYSVGGIKPSSEDSGYRPGVRISNIVEEGRLEYVPVNVLSLSTPGPSNLRVSSGKSKKRKVSRSPVKRHFEIASPLSSSQRHGVVEHLGFIASLDRQQSCRKSRRSGWNRKAARVFQCGLLLFGFELCKLLYILHLLLLSRHLQYETVFPLSWLYILIFNVVG